MTHYYDRLSAERLRRCYELAPQEVRTYLETEIEFILECTKPGARVLELGCGYGRVLRRLVNRTGRLVGIDLSLASLALARQELEGPKVALAQMDVASLAFRPAAFDLVCCPQNGISAFRVNQRELIASAVRLVAPGGKALFFSYAESFWGPRLEWFRIQSAHGLVGEIDEEATGDGTIVCKDGFTATTVSTDRFRELVRGIGLGEEISVLGRSSVVCAITA